MPHTDRVDRLPNGGWDPRLLVFANPPLVQVFAVITRRYVVLIDTLINPATAQTMLDHLAPWLSARALLVVNTHADYDHAWGNQLFAGDAPVTSAPIIGHRRCAAEFAAPATTALLAEFRAREPHIFGDVILTPPTVRFDDALTLDGGDLTLELIPTPGHTPDHISVWLPAIGTLLAGDAAELPFPFAAQPADLPAMRASIARLAALQPTAALYCHAPVACGPQLLRDNLAYFDALEGKCREALARGVEPDAVPDDALPGVVDCRYADVTPQTPPWLTVDAATAAQDHARQLRMMLAWLAQAA